MFTEGAHIKTNNYSVFVMALFITVPNWKQPQFPFTREQINELWYIQLTTPQL